jgi:hypothetical protein
MRATLESSLCMPEDRPIRLRLEPTTFTLEAEGKPRLSVSPFEVELPTIEITLPKPTIVLPKPTFEGMGYLIPLVETPLIPPGQRRMPVSRQGAGGNYDPAERSVSAGPAVGIEFVADLGTIDIDLGKLTVEMGKVRMHGVPVKGNDLPFWVETDLDAIKVTASTEAVEVTLRGCVELDGGHREEDKPPARRAPRG